MPASLPSTRLQLIETGRSQAERWTSASPDFRHRQNESECFKSEVQALADSLGPQTTAVSAAGFRLERELSGVPRLA